MTATLKIANGDVVFDQATGRPLMVTDLDKLRQDVDHFTVNSVDGVVGKIDSTAGVQAEIINRLRAALTSLQAAHEQTQRRDRTNGERLALVKRLVVAPIRNGNTTLKTAWSFTVEVLSAAGLTKGSTGLSKTISG